MTADGSLVHKKGDGDAPDFSGRTERDLYIGLM